MSEIILKPANPAGHSSQSAEAPSIRDPLQFSVLRQFYGRRRVLVTGHTGFKGSWLALWLARMGAEVYGFALPPDQGPENLYERAGVASVVRGAEIDVRHPDAVLRYMDRVQPQLVFHLAARAWVQQGYEDPLATFATNTLGTAHVLEAARQVPSVETVICVTSDKVYRDRGRDRAYRESDELGGSDPYSASKAAAELIVRCYSDTLRPSGRRLGLATARGGNVIGGGDWSPHRIVPDIVRAIRSGQPLRLRRPEATRPWQHVLDLSCGYLILGYRLTREAKGEDGFQAWNFGPAPDAEMTVAALVSAFIEDWGESDCPIEPVVAPLHETTALRLDSSRANERLGWQPVLNNATAIAWTASWYRRYLQDSGTAAQLVSEQLELFEDLLASTLSARSSAAQRA
jgi:CDP-glucose 4,6-dehydratase